MPSAKQQLEARMRRLAAEMLEVSGQLHQFSGVAPWSQFAFPLGGFANTVTLVCADIEATPEPVQH